MIQGKVREAIVKYIFKRKKKVILCHKLRKNQRKASTNTSALIIVVSWVNNCAYV
jgi:hypothetical protein